ncbi:hypothetical protein GOB93_03390 [Acetobacter musti]|uniref:Uncharacterized protein n=1 Tax=Acetobacter musti TaxID=864732 RepID=A0ABX0JJY9_9PROT|nr:hypothetical protein [Acetobacter musti]NHN83684.1 hypothetical protein [Acetobacter musti]
MDPISNPIAYALAQLIGQLPGVWATWLMATWAFLCATSNLILVRWRPPDAGTKMAVLYQIVRLLALSRGFNAAAYGPGYKPLLIPKDMPRDQAAAALDLHPDQTKPRK